MPRASIYPGAPCAGVVGHLGWLVGLAAPHHAPAAGVHTGPQPFPRNSPTGPKEEKDVSHEAFMHAFEASRPPTVRIPGLQEFAAAIWERRRRIPSTMYNDPLDHIFAEFDEDSDGSLSAGEITRALESRGVAATEEAVQAYIDGGWGEGTGSGGAAGVRRADSRGAVGEGCPVQCCGWSAVAGFGRGSLLQPSAALTCGTFLVTPRLSAPCAPLWACVFSTAIDTNSNGRVERAEFANFIFHMASADLHKAAQHTA